MGSRILVGSGFPDHRSADETDAREPTVWASASDKRLTENKAPGLPYVFLRDWELAELGWTDAGRVARARHILNSIFPIRRGPGLYSQAHLHLLGSYHFSWGT
jgi:hypothetical protein